MTDNRQKSATPSKADFERTKPVRTARDLVETARRLGDPSAVPPETGLRPATQMTHEPDKP